MPRNDYGSRYGAKKAAREYGERLRKHIEERENAKKNTLAVTDAATAAEIGRANNVESQSAVPTSESEGGS
ncbi:MAG TPA: hypothetical protein VGW57_07575 [Chthoniobacterales bacterium]|nr:hypothetical protein [Chthoniobacterales bacterium]